MRAPCSIKFLVLFYIYSVDIVAMPCSIKFLVLFYVYSNYFCFVFLFSQFVRQYTYLLAAKCFGRMMHLCFGWNLFTRTRGMASMPTSLFVNIVVWFGRNTFLYKLFIIIVKKHCNKKYLNNSTTKLNYSLKTTKYKKINICFSNI